MLVNTGNTRLCSYTLLKIDDTALFICAVFVYVANPGHGYSTSLIKRTIATQVIGQIQ